MPSVRRFHAEETDACFTVRDANGQALGYFCYDDEPHRRSVAIYEHACALHFAPPRKSGLRSFFRRGR